MTDKCTDPELGAMLHAYEVGALSEEDTEQFELHTMSCDFCYNQVADMENHATALRHGPNVHRLVGETGSVEVAVRKASLADWLWPKMPLVIRPAFLIVVIILLVYPAYRGIAPDSGLDARIGPVQSIQFSPTRSTQSTTFSKQRGTTGVISFVFPYAVAGEDYQVLIKAKDDTEIARYTEKCNTNGMMKGHLSLPVDDLEAGDYRLIISLPGDSTVEPTEYYFRIRD